jgi:dynein heavy chain
MEYAPLTRRATKLFFLVHDFSKLSPMYQFTHQWFFSTFLITLRQCLSTKQEPPLTLENIMKVFTRDFFFMVCSQIFDRDKMLFSFMLAYKTLEADSDFDFRQAEFFIKGPLFRVHEMETRNKPKKQDDS